MVDKQMDIFGLICRSMRDEMTHNGDMKSGILCKWVVPTAIFKMVCYTNIVSTISSDVIN